MNKNRHFFTLGSLFKHTMCLSIFLLWLVSIPLSYVHSLPALRGVPLNCGASEEVTQDNLKYIPDEGFIGVGNKTSLKTNGLSPTLSTLRYFPDTSARKYCYDLSVIKGGKYLVRTTYYYGGYDGGKEPPVFDQIIQGTLWSTVNTTADYAMGMSTYYEIIVLSMAKTLSVCLARNQHTASGSSPFISTLELEYLDDSVYNSTDFSKYALATVARNSFGRRDDTIRFPDDQFNRLWQPFNDQNPFVESKSNVTSSDFWNFPPPKAFSSAITTSRGKTLTLNWPLVSLPSTKYYIALYFQDNRTPSPYSWRALSVSINGRLFYKDLNVTTNGVTVYAPEWPLSGQTEITLTPGEDVPVGPLINAGEIFQILPVGGRTLTRDVMAMEDLGRMFDNPPADWSGDPCLPQDHSWTGVTCSQDKLARVISLDLTNMGISGSLPLSIANLTALKRLSLGGNKLTGTIPDLSTLKELQSLHLENNQINGPFPNFLDKLENLHDVNLQNNNLTGTFKMPPQYGMGIKTTVSPADSLAVQSTNN